MKSKTIFLARLFLITLLIISISIYRSTITLETSTNSKQNISIFNIIENIYNEN